MLPDGPESKREPAEATARRRPRWRVMLPLGLACALGVLGAGVCVRGALISGAPYYGEGLTPDAEGQFEHLGAVIARGASGSRMGLHDGYSTLCGYSNEWRPIFCMVYAMALGERARIEPDRREACETQLEQCVRVVLRIPPELEGAQLQAYLSERAAGANAIQLGYDGVTLGVRRRLVSDPTYDVAHLRIVERLVTLIEGNLASDSRDTFWTSDQAAQLYAIWLADQAFGTDHQALFRAWEAAVNARFLDADGLLISEVGTSPDRTITAPMASSVGYTSLFLADVLPEFARRQYRLLIEHRQQRLFSFEATFEADEVFFFGDTNSGPLVFGLSPAATGFAMVCHKRFGERERFARSLRVFEVFGQPQDVDGRRYYYLGNAMGDAILLYGKLVAEEG